MADITIKKYISGTGWTAAYPETTVGQIVATGTPSSSTFLRGDGSWASPSVSDVYVSVASFNTTNGVLTLSMSNLTTVTVDLDGRFAASSHTHAASDINSGVLNTARMGDGTATAGYVLKSDGDGTASWQVDSNTTYTLGSFGITATAAELNTLDGITATVTELNYTDGVTSNIQTQLNGKLSTSGKAADSELLDGIDSSAYLRDDGWNTYPGQDANTQPNMKADFTYSNNAPWTGSLISFGAGNYQMQLNSAYSGGGEGFSFRTRNGDTGTWNGWNTIFHDDYHPNADTWTTARTLTIGNTGKSVNGSGNVSWSLAEIGAAASSHTHDYVPERSRTDWNDSTVIDDVIGQLAWKNYGNNHTIFDASASTAPGGTAKNNTNPDVAWTATYPTLMGWNGTNTYGVRVDSARYSDYLNGYQSSTSATANTIVRRDANNYIYASYINSNRGNEATAAASYIYDTGDGWMRKKTLGNVQAEIVTESAIDSALGFVPVGSSGVTSVATGGGLTGGTITSTGTISHADTSAQASVNNSGNTFIQDITLDTYGHITGITSATATGGSGATWELIRSRAATTNLTQTANGTVGSSVTVSALSAGDTIAIEVNDSATYTESPKILIVNIYSDTTPLNNAQATGWITADSSFRIKNYSFKVSASGTTVYFDDAYFGSADDLNSPANYLCMSNIITESTFVLYVGKIWRIV